MSLTYTEFETVELIETQPTQIDLNQIWRFLRRKLRGHQWIVLIVALCAIIWIPMCFTRPARSNSVVEDITTPPSPSTTETPRSNCFT